MTKISRRSFARDAVVIATAAAVMPSVIAQTPPAPPPTEAKPAGEPAAQTQKLPPASQAEVDARVNWIVTKYGARLDDAQRADIRRLVAGGQAGIDAMRAYPLGNEVEPPTPFRVWRAPKGTK
jgi:hypothetical protein